MPTTLSLQRLLLPVLTGLLLAACGQKGDLYIPQTPAAAQRATLPQTLRPGGKKPAPGPGADRAAGPEQAPAAPASQP